MDGPNLGTYVANGDLLQMDSLLDKYGTNIKSSMDEAYLKCGRVNGKQYVVPTVRDEAASYGYLVREDLVKKYNIDLSSVKTLSDLTPVLKALRQEPNVAPLGSTVAGKSILQFFLSYDPLGDGYGVLLNGGKDTKVTDWYESDEYANDVKLMRSWYQAGYIYKDAATTQESNVTLIKEGKSAGNFAPLKPGLAEQETLAIGSKMVTQPIIDPIATTSTVTSLNWGIPHNSKNSEKAMKFLNLMYSNSDIINLIDYGIEGKDYVKVSGSDNVIDFPSGVTAANSAYNLSMGFEFGNQLLSYVWNGNPPDLWSQMKSFNKEATKSKALGFVFDSTKVTTQEANVANVVKQYGIALDDGVVDPNTILPQFKAALKTAGIDEIIAEKQKQLNDWLKAK